MYRLEVHVNKIVTSYDLSEAIDQKDVINWITNNHSGYGNTQNLQCKYDYNNNTYEIVIGITRYIFWQLPEAFSIPEPDQKFYTVYESLFRALKAYHKSSKDKKNLKRLSPRKRDGILKLASLSFTIEQIEFYTNSKRIGIELDHLVETGTMPVDKTERINLFTQRIIRTYETTVICKKVYTGDIIWVIGKGDSRGMLFPCLIKFFSNDDLYVWPAGGDVYIVNKYFIIDYDNFLAIEEEDLALDTGALVVV